MTPFLIMLICSQSLFATTTFRTSIRDVLNFYCLWPRFHLMTSWKVCTHEEYVSLINSKQYWNCTTWKFIKRYRCQKLKTMVKRSPDQKLRLRKFDARIETGEVVTSRRGLSGVERKKVFVTSGKKKASVRKGDQCSFRHESDDRAQKPEHNAATPSEPSVSRGRSVSKKRSIRGKKLPWCLSPTTVKILFERYLHATAFWMLASSRVSILQNRNGMQS